MSDWESHQNNRNLALVKQTTAFFKPTSIQVRAHLVEAHELGGSVLFGLVEGFEADVSRRFGCVRERTRHGVQIMGPNGHQASLPAQSRLNETKIYLLVVVFFF